MLLSVVIPAYNEKPTIAQVVREALAVDLPAGIEREVLVVDDASTDGTIGQLEQGVQDSRLKILRQKVNMGKAAAVSRGMDQAAGDWILIQDADLEYHPSHYPRLLQPLLEERSDVVYGSRFLGNIRDMQPVNRWANRFSNWTFNSLFGTRLTDINTCFKLFTRDSIRGLKIVSSHFELETEITAKLVRRGMRIMEVPVDYQARSQEQGKKINWPKALRMYFGILWFRWL